MSLGSPTSSPRPFQPTGKSLKHQNRLFFCRGDTDSAAHLYSVILSSSRGGETLLLSHHRPCFLPARINQARHNVLCRGEWRALHGCPLRPYQRRLQATTFPSESMQEQGALARRTTHARTVVCVEACAGRAPGAGHEIYICYRAPHRVREVLVDLLNLSIIQHNVDLIMHSETSLEIT